MEIVLRERQIDQISGHKQEDEEIDWWEKGQGDGKGEQMRAERELDEEIKEKGTDRGNQKREREKCLRVMERGWKLRRLKAFVMDSVQYNHSTTDYYSGHCCLQKAWYWIQKVGGHRRKPHPTGMFTQLCLLSSHRMIQMCIASIANKNVYFFVKFKAQHLIFITMWADASNKKKLTTGSHYSPEAYRACRELVEASSREVSWKTNMTALCLSLGPLHFPIHKKTHDLTSPLVSPWITAKRTAVSFSIFCWAKNLLCNCGHVSNPFHFWQMSTKSTQIDQRLLTLTLFLEHVDKMALAV